MSELVAAVVAVILTIVYTHWKDRQDDDEQERAARRMLSLEVNRNLTLASELKVFLETEYKNDLIELVKTDEYLSWPNTVYTAQAIASTAKIPWSQTVWKSHLNVAASTLPVEQAASLFSHHGHVERVSEFRDILDALHQSQADQYRGTPLQLYARSAMKPLIAELLALLALGNPITPPDPPLWKHWMAKMPRGITS